MPQKKVKKTNNPMCKVMFETMGNATIRAYMKWSHGKFNCVNICSLISKPKDGEQVCLLHIWILYNNDHSTSVIMLRVF